MRRRTGRILAAMVLTAMLVPAMAQPALDTNWKRGGTLAINLSQVSLSDWAAGGDNAIGFNIQFVYFANYKKQKQLWNNRLELDYGLNKTKSNGTRKTNDNIYFSSLYGYKLRQDVYLSGLLSFQTQFAKGYDYNNDPHTYISRFMSPGYLMLGGGLTWTPKAWFTATLTPATWRGTFVASKVLSEEGQFGVPPGKHLFSEFGANLRMEVHYEFLKNMTVFSRLAFYTNYLKQPQNIDITWDMQLNMSINKWFATTLSTSLIYDNDTKTPQQDGREGARVQFKEALAVGFQITL